MAFKKKKKLKNKKNEKNVLAWLAISMQ